VGDWWDWLDFLTWDRVLLLWIIPILLVLVGIALALGGNAQVGHPMWIVGSVWLAISLWIHRLDRSI